MAVKSTSTSNPPHHEEREPIRQYCPMGNPSIHESTLSLFSSKAFFSKKVFVNSSSIIPSTGPAAFGFRNCHHLKVLLPSCPEASSWHPKEPRDAEDNRDRDANGNNVVDTLHDGIRSVHFLRSKHMRPWRRPI